MTHSNDMLIYIKYFEPITNRIRFIGSHMVSSSDTVSSVYSSLRSLLSIGVDEEIEIYEEREHMDIMRYERLWNKSLSLNQYELGDGDILIVQKAGDNLNSVMEQLWYKEKQGTQLYETAFKGFIIKALECVGWQVSHDCPLKKIFASVQAYYKHEDHRLQWHQKFCVHHNIKTSGDLNDLIKHIKEWCIDAERVKAAKRAKAAERAKRARKTAKRARKAEAKAKAARVARALAKLS